MINKDIQLLLDIYSSLDAESIDNNTDYIALCKRNAKFSWFNEVRLKIENIHNKIEKLNTFSSKSQVIEALYFMFKIFKKDESSFFYGKFLVENKLYINWSQEQINYFEGTLIQLTECFNDYFLSFTSRMTSEGHNLLHLNYKYFIKHILQIEDWTKAVKKAKENKTNLLALAINTLMSEKLEGFYYPSQIGDNKVVNEKLKSNCRNSFTFVQVIQNVLFRHADRENYCYTEYTYAETSISSDHRLYILAERNRDNLLKRHAIIEDYENWYEEILSKDLVHLPFTESFNLTQLNSMRILIEEDVVKKIERLKELLFENAPS